MLVPILIASGLGMAIWSAGARERTHQQGLAMTRMALTGAEKKPRSHAEAILEEIRELGSTPSLWEAFGIYHPQIYAVYVSDGYLIEAHIDPSEAMAAAKHFQKEEGTTDVAVVEHALVDWQIGSDVLDPETWNFGDGYEASEALTKATHGPTFTHYEWNMQRDEAFEDWDEENQEAWRQDVIHSLTTRFIAATTTLYHPTVDLDRWEETFDEDVVPEGLWLTNNRAHALATLRVLAIAHGSQGRPRLLVFRAGDKIAPLILLPKESRISDLFAVGFEVDLEDPEEVDRVTRGLTDFPSDGIIEPLENTPDIYEVTLNQDGLEALVLETVEEPA